MSYSDDIASLSRKPTYICRLYLDSTISGGTEEFITLGEIPSTEGYLPCVNRIDWVAARAAIEGGLGYFGIPVIHATDFNYGSKGTFFGKLIASNDYFLNRICEIYVGYWSHGETFNLSNFQKRTYFIKTIKGPNNKGAVSIELSDALSRLNDSQVPAATEGELDASITDSQTGSVDITDNAGFSASGGYALIDDEIVAYSGITGGDSITISSRGQGGTTAEAHDADAPVRVIYQDNGNVVDVIRTLIENETEIDHASYIPDADWNTQRDDFLASDTVDLWVIEPTKASEIIEKLAEQTYLNIWWDDAAQEIKLKAIGPSLASIGAWNDADNILDGKVIVKRDNKKIISEVWIYFGKIDKVKGNDPKNFDSVYKKSNADIETGLGEPRIKKIFADSVPNTGTGTAAKIAGRLIGQNNKPLEIQLLVDAKDSGINVGDAITIQTSLLQDKEGDPTPVIMRVYEKKPRDNNRYQYKLIRSGQDAGDRYARIGPDTLNDYTSESTTNQDNYGFISDNDPDMSNGDDPYLIL